MPKLNFTREHYEAIAVAMQSAHKHNWQAICEKLADMLKRTIEAFGAKDF